MAESKMVQMKKKLDSIPNNDTSDGELSGQMSFNDYIPDSAPAEKKTAQKKTVKKDTAGVKAETETPAPEKKTPLTKEKPVSVYLTRIDKAYLKALSAAVDKPISQLIREACSWYVDDYKHDLTEAQKAVFDLKLKTLL